jgi:hypothetical protein
MTALSLTFFDDCCNEPAKNWLIKGVIAAGEHSSWYGPPGALKSALLTDIAVHLAAERDWRGHRVRQRTGVVYFAFERAALTKRRLAAYKIRDGLEGLPVAVAGDIVDRVNPECIDTIVATVREAETQFGCPVGLVIIDTYAKGIAAGGGDEDKALHVNIVASNLKVVQEQLRVEADGRKLEHPVHIATIGHTGKDETRGERGSNAKLGHVDLAVGISGENIKTATVTKGNDQSGGALTTFSAQEIVIGEDEDGEPLTTSILSTDVVAAPVKAAKPNARHALAVAALERVIRDHGQPAPAGSDIPSWLRVATVDQWREELFRCGILNRKVANPRSPFKKLKDGMMVAKRIVERDGFIWPMQPGGIYPPPFSNSPSITPSPVPSPVLHS